MGIDGEDLHHLCLAGLQIDRTMNVQAITAAARRDGDGLILGRPAAHRAHLMGRVNRIGEHRGLVDAKLAQQPLIGFDEGFLLGRVELAGDQIGFAIGEAEPVQQSDQAGVAVFDATRLTIQAPMTRVLRGKLVRTHSNRAASCSLLRRLWLPPRSNATSPVRPCSA